MRATITIEIDATDHFQDGTDSVDWKYCMAHASFRHTDACEFIVHVGPDRRNDDSFKDHVAKMKSFGCSEDFIDDYESAAEMGAERVLFYA